MNVLNVAMLCRLFCMPVYLLYLLNHCIFEFRELRKAKPILFMKKHMAEAGFCVIVHAKQGFLRNVKNWVTSIGAVVSLINF